MLAVAAPTIHSPSLLHAPAPFLQKLSNSASILDDEIDSNTPLALAAGVGITTPPRPFTFTIDSASEIHLLKLEDALQLFASLRQSDLQVIGVSGASKRADVQGHLIMAVRDPRTGMVYHVDLGLAHGMAGCPLNLLSVSLLLKVGAIAHFETDNCYFMAHAGAPRIPFLHKDGMFQIMAESSLVPDVKPKSKHSFAAHGQCFATSATFKTWHRRLGHMSPLELSRIHKAGLVDGFKVTGPVTSSCKCDTCHQARIRRVATPRHREYEDRASFIGHTVSADLKSLPYESFRGDRYVICYVDHYSRLSFVYFLKSKDQVTSSLRSFVADFSRLGFRVHTIQTDRGSEFFEQEGESHFNRGRRLHEFNLYCEAQQPPVLHIVQPVEMKEKLAETRFLDLFKDVECMLWEARLSPAFWADACAYSNHIHNSIPHVHLGGTLSPSGLASGHRPRWDKFKVFGCDVYEVIPNDPYAKYPGVPRGRKLIFVGFDSNRAGFKVFDPETRTYHSTGNAYFVEDFSDRIDALRHHDQRRNLLRRRLEQPIVIDDFDDTNSQAVRSLFTDPDALPPENSVESTPPSGDASHGGALTQPDVHLGGASTSPNVQRGGVSSSRSDKEQASDDHYPSGPLGPISRRSVAAERVRRQAQQNVMLRPLRLLSIGKEAPYTPEDQAFLAFVKTSNIPLVYRQPNPKKTGSLAHRRYNRYMLATSFSQAAALGSTWDDFVWDYRRGFIAFPKHEPSLSGHVYCALDLAAQHGHTHVLQDLGLYFKRSHSTDVILARAFNARGVHSFNDALATVFEPEVILHQLQDSVQRNRLADNAFAQTMHNTASSLDYSIAPEPTRYEQVLPDVCPEHVSWKEAMDDEIASMVQFGVYRRLPRSAAGTRQILGCRWVYRRKVGKDGRISRYKARLVAQGHRQRPYDSFDPDDISSPVVLKDTLRMFFSLCAQLNLHVFQADVKSAFLQAPLSERIFMRAPPGYSSRTSSGEEEILELEKAIYGLKQGSASFYHALHLHLTENGYVSQLGDPCLFRKVLPDGRFILVAIYVDDLLYGVPEDQMADDFLAMIRQRFVVDEGEGKPMEFVLGMAVHQDLAAGTVSIDMAMVIDKLAHGVLTPEELVKSKGVHTPMLLGPLPRLTTREVSKEEFDFLSVLGSLLHLANCVRIDIATSVNILARHAANPGRQHVKALKRVLQYVYNKKNLGIRYSRSSAAANMPLIFEAGKHPLDNGSSSHFQVFSDADYAMDDSRRSIMGVIIMLNGGPISWTSTLGKTVATSTAEAEINAAVTAAKDALHVKQLLVDLGLMAKHSPIKIAEDNSAAIAQAESGLRHVRNAKHYEVRLRFLQQLVVDKEVQFVYTPTTEQLADFMTKPLDIDTFSKFRDLLLHPVSTFDI